jgi:hypothetical protein
MSSTAGKLLDMAKTRADSTHDSGIRRRDKPFKLLHLEELPEKPQQGTIYAIGEGTPWAPALLCPCGCGALIQLSLLKDERPSWKAPRPKKAD